MVKISTESILKDLRGLARYLGYSPSHDEYEEFGKYGTTTIAGRLGSWSEAKEAANASEEEFPRPDSLRKEISNEELCKELQRLKEGHGYISVPLMKEYGRYSHTTYSYRFGSWNEALVELGFETTEEHKIGKEKLASSVLEIAEEIDRPLEIRDIDRHTEHGQTTVYTYFDSFGDLLEYVGLTPERVELNCDNCSKKVSKKRSHVTTNNFCSTECYKEWRKENWPSGEDSPIYEGGGPWYYGDNWGEKRQAALERDDGRCQYCGMGRSAHREEFGKDIAVHHIKPINSFENPKDANYLENLITLCDSCHPVWEGMDIMPRLID